MKKLIWTLSALGLALSAAACDNGTVVRLCDINYVDKCEDGMWLHCQYSEDSGMHEIFATATITINKRDYMCNSEDVLVLKAECDNGKILTSDGAAKDAICGDNNEIYTCNGDTVVRNYAYCSDNKVIKCADGELKTIDCGNDICETYERGDSTHAGCFKNDNIKTGCEAGLKPYGVCDDTNSKLKFCTSSKEGKGKTIELDCASENKVCMLVEDSFYGYDCVKSCKNSESSNIYTDRGLCEGDTLHWCEPTNEEKTEFIYRSYSCSENKDVKEDDKYYNKVSCGFAGDFFDCI